MTATPNVDPSHEINGISMGINSIVVGISQRLLMGVGRGWIRRSDRTSV